MKIFLFPLIAGALAGWAVDEPSTNLTVTVTATPIVQSESVSRTGAETAIVTRHQLAKLNAQDLQTALRQIPGVAISRYAPIGSYGGAQGGSVYIRGLGTGRPGGEIRTYTDGAPRESGVWGHPLMDAMPVDFADAITVHKNPQPQSFPGTFGAVDVETRRRRTEGCEGEIDTAYGRFNTLLSSAQAGVKEGPVDAYGGLAYKYSEGARRHNSAEMENAFARVGTDLSDHEHLGFVYQRTESWVEDPGEKHAPTPIHDRFDLATDLYTVRFDTERDTLKGHSLVYFEHGAIEWRKDHLTEGNLQSPAGTADTTWLNWGFRNSYDWEVVEHLILSGALDVVDEGGHTENERFDTGAQVFGFKARFVSVAPYLGARYEIPLTEEWTLTPSLGSRYYFHEVYDDEWGPCAALTLAREEDLQFFVNGSRGVHYPGIYTRAVADDFAKGTLDAETMNSASGGVKVKADDQLDLLATVFHTDVDNRIDKTATGYVNSGALRATGLETSAHLYPTEDLSFFLGGTFTNPETSDPSRLPRWTFSAGGSWKICDWLRWDLDGQYIGSMNSHTVRVASERDDLRRLDDAFIFNTRLAVPLKSFSRFDGDIYLSLENLTNQHYEYYPGYEMPGVMVYTGVKFKF